MHRSHSTSRPRAAVLMMALLAGSITARAETSDLPVANPEAVGFSSERLKRLDALLERAVDEKQYGGIVVLLARHGKVVYFESKGKPTLANAEGKDKERIFRIASMTKPVTAAAMMLLYEEGKWSPKDPIAKFIPEFAHLKVYKELTDLGKIIVEEPEHPPTIRELMTHTAGFSYGWGSSPVDQLYQGERGRNIFALFETGSLQAMIERLAKVPLLYQPGSQWVYSVSVDIQGHLVEKLSGMTLPQFMRKRLFEPLGMRDTGFYVPSEKRGRLATLYTTDERGRLTVSPPDPPFFGTNFSSEPSLPSGGAGLVSTAADYFRFAQMLLNGGELDGVRVLAPATVKLMMSNHLADHLMTQYASPSGDAPRAGLGYGYGGGVVIDAGRADVPLGVGTYLWAGGYGTWVWADPTYGIVFVGMLQKAPGRSDAADNSVDVQELSRALTYQALLNPEL